MIKKFIFYLKDSIDERAEDFGAQYIAFGIFGIINYPIFYLIWRLYNESSYENFTLRFIATFLCFLLLLKNHWPKKLTPWFSVYWYFTLLFCLPFFFFFMLFKNSGSSAWLMSANTILFWLPLMVDWLSYIIIFGLGIILAISYYAITSTGFNFSFYHWWGLLAQLVASFILVAFFVYNKQKFDREKFESMKVLGASIAHELRTPLGSIANGIAGVKKYFPLFLDTYRIAKENKLEIPYIRPDHFEKLLTILEDVESETEFANTIINMLLVKVRQIETKSIALEECSMVDCINDAIHRYPFGSDKQRALIHWEEKNDFEFMGNKMLMVHVLFNLIKNALYYIEVAEKGEIFISLNPAQSSEEKYHQLCFKDTGKGMSAKVLSKLFTRFFTTSPKGTGLGLSFCKTVANSFRGDIVCQSREGEYAEFIMSLPKIQD